MPSATDEKVQATNAVDEREDTEQPRTGGSYAMMEPAVRRVYFKFYQESYKNVPGGLDRKTKEFVAIAASLATGCKNCLEGHLKKAVEYGATRQELSETLAVAVGVGAASIVDRSDIASMNISLDDLLEESSGNGKA